VDDAPSVPAPLAGLRVLDLTRNLAGPFCTMILGDLGADVIKIEQPGTGDDTRAWTPPAWQGESATYLSSNRNKRSVVIDLNQPEGAALVRDLARQSDILVESFKPGSLEKRGLGYDSLRAENERLIYCSVSAFGNVGPQRNRPGYDPVLQAHTGIMHMTGEPEQPGVRLGIGAMDMGASLWLVIGVFSALSARAQHGRGTRIETSLYEIAAWWLSYHMAGYLGSGVDPMRQGSRTPMISPYETFPTRDGTWRAPTTTCSAHWPVRWVPTNWRVTRASLPTAIGSRTATSCGRCSHPAFSLRLRPSGKRCSIAIRCRVAACARWPTWRPTNRWPRSACWPPCPIPSSTISGSSICR
jgi:crotonobetainyl-CoA:carnitine CoA-transferase CaiB-like acyl-CoA transferase